MVKAKKNTVHLPLVVTGFILFILLVITVLASTTIPFGRMLFDPRVLHVNVAVTALALTVGAILPVLLGYIIGDHAIKSKSKLSHYFNGILFGLLAYWLMSLSIFITLPRELMESHNTWIVLVNVLPGLGVAIIASILAVAHVRSRQAKQDIIEYKPFAAVLIGSMVVVPVWSLVSSIVTNTMGIYSFVSLATIAALGLVSYVSLRKTRLTTYKKILWSAVSLSVIFVTAYVSSQLVYTVAVYIDPQPTMESQAMVSGLGFVLAVVGWAIYWTKQVKTLHK